MPTSYDLDQLVDQVNTRLPFMVEVNWDCEDGLFSLNTLSWEQSVSSLTYPNIEELHACVQGMLAGLELSE